MKSPNFLSSCWIKWPLAVLGWTALGLFFASRNYLLSAYSGQPFSIRFTILVSLADWYPWALLTPIILILARKYGLDRGHLLRNLSIHIPCSIVFSVVHLIVFTIAMRFIATAPPGGLPPFGRMVQSYFPNNLHSGVMTYWVIVSIGYAISYYRRYKEGELRAADMRERLVQAQLQALKMQLHPHFLFNTLHAISTLMHRDVEAADRMLARLSDLLRLTLENVGVQEVTLKQELEFLEGYLEIERTRFQDRLSVKMNIDGDVLDAAVPNLILQPLVENAVRHGIAPRAAAGHIDISASHQNGMLRIQIRDDGPGLPKGQAASAKEGVGISNTRARLAQLYGDNQRFDLIAGDKTGLIVNLEVPFKIESLEKKDDSSSDSRRRTVGA